MTKRKVGKGSKQDDIIIISSLYKIIIESSKEHWFLSLEPDEPPNKVFLSVGEKNIGTETILINHKFIPYLIQGLSKYIERIKEN